MLSLSPPGSGGVGIGLASAHHRAPSPPATSPSLLGRQCASIATRPYSARPYYSTLLSHTTLFSTPLSMHAFIDNTALLTHPTSRALITGVTGGRKSLAIHINTSAGGGGSGSTVATPPAPKGALAPLSGPPQAPLSPTPLPATPTRALCTQALVTRRWGRGLLPPPPPPQPHRRLQGRPPRGKGRGTAGTIDGPETSHTSPPCPP